MKNLSQELIRKAAVDGERHYIGHLAALSGSLEMYSNAGIFADDGSHLVNEGVRVSSKFFKRLNGLRLVKPLDDSLTIEDNISLSEIISDLGDLLKEDQVLKHVPKVAEELKKYGIEMAEVQLPAPSATKLTVLKNQLPSLYWHSLQVVLMALYISSEMKFDTESRNSLLLAALFHDIGELCVDPEIINGNSKLSDAERYQIYAHPVIAYMSLKELPLFRGDVTRAILEHHERLDGSGYPRSIKGENVGFLGSALGIVEFSVGVRDKYPINEALIHLRIMLSIHENWFPAELVDTVTKFTREVDLSDYGVIDTAEKDVVLGKLFTIDMILRDWQAQNDQLRKMLLSNPERRLLGTMDERLLALHQAFMRIGLQSDSIIVFVDSLMDDNVGLNEVIFMAEEIQFQLKSLILEIRRHWPDDKFEESPYHLFAVWLDQVGTTFFSH